MKIDVNRVGLEPRTRPLARRPRPTRASSTLALGLSVWAVTRVPDPPPPGSNHDAAARSVTDLSDDEIAEVWRSGDEEPTKAELRAAEVRRWPHRGTVLEAGVGPVVCIGGLCRPERHSTQAGARVSGFFGGNIHGWVEMGVSGGWASLRSHVADGTNPLAMYGVDAGQLNDAITEETGKPMGLDLEQLTVSEARTQSVQLGPALRVHFLPRGRFMGWVGSGASYHLLRNDYETVVGRLRIDFHGMAIPVEVGLGVAVHKHFAVVAHVGYHFTWHWLSVLKSPVETLALPTSMIQEKAEEQGADIVGQLPRFLAASVGVRTRF